MAGTSVLILIAAVFIIVLVLWICLPFAVFGTKPLLEQLLAETRTTNELLRKLKLDQ